MSEPYVHKLFAGKVKRVGDPNAKDPMERVWETGMFKSEIDGQIWLGKTGLSGDEVGDKKNHGGPEKALFAYPIKHYTYWKKELPHVTMNVGGMGENMAVLEMDEFSVCIGDTYKFGDAIIQVSQPRRPCWRPARRYKVLDLALRIQNSGRTGWYYRVLREGYVISQIDLELIERPYPQWTIAACNEIMYVEKDNLRLADELASCPLLSENWKRTLKKRLRGQESSPDKRVYGPNQP
ncbi:MAG TPA: MOSC domain-containing protein [Bacillota bacterium]|nr:MOSC domain-containing protein [Bacillota bacterium]